MDGSGACDSLLGSGEYLTTRSVLRTHIHLAADGSQSPQRTTSYLLDPIYQRSANDINVHFQLRIHISDVYFSRNGPGVFIFPSHGLALYFYSSSSSSSSSSHPAMDLERNSSISLYHGFMTDL